ncbi:MAG: site-specific integrase, partial [Gammaproteobacteria bacterium]|nr:site-specific integrase [Gammaproteobacteria bacterium]
MVLKKQEFKDDEIAIFDEACVYKRGEYWQFRLWLPKENKYARKSLRTRSETTAVER